ncbi:MAG TPA: bifunctional phosphoglucose/phosphomannose isomerase [Streptosporangiaceae bacterium]|nr:bifunctional phosphoglucose/phosphomannose isomerase [Streptosporangiaceae bacterium]
MTPAVAPGRLDDVAALEAADPLGMLRQVASSAAQVRESVQAAAEADLAELIGGGRPRAIVVTGMGGSGIAGDVLAAVCGTGCPVQVTTVHDYRLPGWVGAADLVIAVSCSGSTEETLSAAEEAVRRGCRLLAVGGQDSPLTALAEQARGSFIPVRSAGMPRATLWGLSVPLVVVAARLGIVDMPADAYESAAAELERVSHLCRPDSEGFVNPGKSLALELAGTLPMVWGTSGLTEVAARRFACQLNENAKYPAVPGVLPEANHNQVVAFDGPFALGGHGRAPGENPAVPLRLVVLRDTHEHPQVTRRREESIRLASDRGIEVTELAALGQAPLERLASLVQLIDYATVYLGIALGIDPGPVAVIQELKARIA